MARAGGAGGLDRANPAALLELIRLRCCRLGRGGSAPTRSSRVGYGAARLGLIADRPKQGASEALGELGCGTGVQVPLGGAHVRVAQRALDRDEVDPAGDQ